MSFYKILTKERAQLKKRLDSVQESTMKVMTATEEELSKSFFERVVRPSLQSASDIAGKFLPKQKGDQLKKRLILAGNPGNLTANEFLAIRYGISLLLAGGMGTLSFIFGFDKLPFLLSGGLLLGLVAIDFYLKMRIDKRQRSIVQGLPDVLDLMTVSVEAGLGFDSALYRVVDKTEGPLSTEFSKTLKEIQMGKARRDALKDLGTRTGVDDLNNFVSAIIQADQLGVSIGKVLRVQSEQMRQLRRQRIEEKAMKAPIKMLIPMILFIFPAIFIVLLGPAALQMIATFGSGN